MMIYDVLLPFLSTHGRPIFNGRIKENKENVREHFKIGHFSDIILMLESDTRFFVMLLNQGFMEMEILHSK